VNFGDPHSALAHLGEEGVSAILLQAKSRHHDHITTPAPSPATPNPASRPSTPTPPNTTEADATDGDHLAGPARNQGGISEHGTRAVTTWLRGPRLVGATGRPAAFAGAAEPGGNPAVLRRLGEIGVGGLRGNAGHCAVCVCPQCEVPGG
jgi:hypothetical protein